MTKEQADRIAKGCKRFEYDESGLGKLSMYGYNCTTCNHNNDCKRLKEATEDKQENALAKLAEELESLIPKDKDIRELDQRRWNAVAKAQRIVAEMAKYANVKMIPQECCDCSVLKTIGRCRAIAEEGANNAQTT